MTEDPNKPLSPLAAVPLSVVSIAVFWFLGVPSILLGTVVGASIGVLVPSFIKRDWTIGQLLLLIIVPGLIGGLVGEFGWGQ